MGRQCQVELGNPGVCQGRKPSHPRGSLPPRLRYTPEQLVPSCPGLKEPGNSKTICTWLFPRQPERQSLPPLTRPPNKSGAGGWLRGLPAVTAPPAAFSPRTVRAQLGGDTTAPGAVAQPVSPSSASSAPCSSQPRGEQRCAPPGGARPRWNQGVMESSGTGGAAKGWGGLQPTPGRKRGQLLLGKGTRALPGDRGTKSPEQGMFLPGQLSASSRAAQASPQLAVNSYCVL